MKLKNGSEEHDARVQVTMFTLRDLFKNKPIHFYELVQVARNKNHVPFGLTGQDLASMSLLSRVEDGPSNWRFTMHDSVRNVILSTVEGEMLDLTISNPQLS